MFWNRGGQAEFMEGTQQKYLSLSPIDENRLLHQRLSANLSRLWAHTSKLASCMLRRASLRQEIENNLVKD